MERITKPRKPNESRNVFTEGIDYFKTGKSSIWCPGDKFTLKFLDKTNITGKWLNLAAGDGRYNLNLLKKAELVVASDIDESALSKLWHTTPEIYRNKLKTKAFNVIKKFPFANNSFDGIFSAGTLHLFQKKMLIKIFSEIDRVLKPKGKVIIDFAVDIRRVGRDGETITFGNEPLYTMDEARMLLKDIFKNYRIRMYESETEEEYPQANPPYRFSCRFILVFGKEDNISKKKFDILSPGSNLNISGR